MFADPRWLKRLRSGVTLILWALLAAVICYIGLFISVIAFFVPSGGPPDLGYIQVPMIVVGLGLWTAWLISVIRLTSPERGGTAGGRPRRRTLAKWIVALTAAPALSMLIYGLSSDMMTPSPQLPSLDGWLIVRFVFSYTANVAGMVGFFLLLIAMRRIARRHTAKGLGKLMSVMIWGSTAQGVGWIAATAAMVGMGLFMSTSALAATTTSAPAGLAALGYTSSPTTAGARYTSFRVGANVSTPPAVGPATSRPSTGPATTMPAPPAVPAMPAFLRSGWMLPGLFLLLIIEFGTFGWMICGVVALFWFRSVFSGAIVQNVSHPLDAVAASSDLVPPQRGGGS